MATFLTKLFKPKWQSKHTPTRLEAVKALDANDEEQHQALLSIAAKDTSTDVRKAALERINLTDALIDLHKSANEELQKAIEERLYALASAQSLTLFDLIVDSALLTDMIVRSDKPDVFINGLARIEDPKALLNIALNSKTSKIRCAAAELIETEEQLNELTQAAKSKDKSVYQIAKLKLSNIKSQIKTQESRLADIEQTLISIQEHAQTENTKLYDAKLETLSARWQKLKEYATETQVQKFNSAFDICRQKQADIQARQNLAENEEQRLRTGGDEQEATLQTLSDTLQRFRTLAASPQEVSALDALIKTQETRWLEATKMSKVGKAQQKHYQLLIGELKNYLRSLKSLAEATRQLAELSAALAQKTATPAELLKHTQQLQKLVNKIAWPDDYQKPEQLKIAAKALGHSEDIKQALNKNTKELSQKISSLLEKLDRALDDKHIKQSAKTLKEIQGLLSQLDSKTIDRFQNQLSLRMKQLNDLRDWQGFAASPRQVALCETMEKLAEQHLDPQAKADKIKAMQKEWKTLGGAANQEIWERFKLAADKAYEPCKAYFEEQKRLKASNLERRKTLIEQLAGFIEGNDWSAADWKAVERIEQQAKAEWKAAFPVDFKANKAQQTQFNELLAKLDQYLDGEREANLVLKTQIVTAAEDLIEHEDLDHAINEAKSLQRRWQNIGITKHKQDRALWKKFRAACDQIFARREQAKDSRKQEIEAAIGQTEAFLLALESLTAELGEKTSEELKQALTDYRKQFKQLPTLPKNKADSTQQRFEKAVALIKQQRNTLENQRRRAQWLQVQQKAKLCRQLHAGEIDSQRASAGEFDSEFDGEAEAIDSPLQKDLKSVWISLKAGALKSEFVHDDTDARAHCIRCEIATGIDSPDSDKELRMQLQVSRLSEGMSSFSESQSREEQLSELLADWYQKVGLSLKDYAPLETRIQRCIDALFG